MSTIKVDTIATRTGSGNITLSNNVASLTSAGAISGTNLTASGTLAVTGLTTMSGNASVTGDTATITLTDSSSHSANTGPAISFFSNDSGGTSREVAKIVGESHSGANEGNLALQTRNGGTLETKWKVFKNGNLLPSSTDYGIYLGVTAASGDANLLNDYEEGEWTPTYVPANGAFGGSYLTQRGRYTKVGRKVYVEFQLVANFTNNTQSGNVQIGGLPFTATAHSSGGAYGSLTIAQSTRFTGAAPKAGQIYSGQTNIYIWTNLGVTGAGSDQTQLTTSNFILSGGNPNNIVASMVYLAD